MIKLEDINKNVQFLEKEHKYINKEGKELISTTTLIKLYTPVFDPHGFIVKNKAKKEGKTVEEMLLEWEKARNEAGTKGKALHSEIEFFIKNKKIKRNSEFTKVVKQFSKFNFKGRLVSELPISSLKYLIGGTVDLLDIIDEKNSIIDLYDFKRTKKFEEKSKYKSNLLYPISNISNCELGKFAVQIGIYEFILKEYGYKVNKRIVFWLNPETQLLEEKEIPSIQEDIIRLLNHYNSLLDF